MLLNPPRICRPPTTRLSIWWESSRSLSQLWTSWRAALSTGVWTSPLTRSSYARWDIEYSWSTSSPCRLAPAIHRISSQSQHSPSPIINLCRYQEKSYRLFSLLHSWFHLAGEIVTDAIGQQVSQLWPATFSYYSISASFKECLRLSWKPFVLDWDLPGPKLEWFK